MSKTSQLLGLEHAARLHLGTDAIDLVNLHRALHPEEFGLDREPLTWPEPGSDSAAAILRLLKAGNVPTAVAVRAVVAESKEQALAAARIEEERQQLRNRVAAEVRSDLALFGAPICAAVDSYWGSHGTGPTWREAFASDPASVLIRESLNVTDDQLSMTGKLVIIELHRRAWLTSTKMARSLQVGPAYLAHCTAGGDAGLNEYGWYIANAVGRFRAHHNQRSPSWEELARTGRAPSGWLLFNDTDDALAQADWLMSKGWLRLDEHGQIRRGDAAKKLSEARRAAREAAALAPKDQ